MTYRNYLHEPSSAHDIAREIARRYWLDLTDPSNATRTLTYVFTRARCRFEDRELTSDETYEILEHVQDFLEDQRP